MFKDYLLQFHREELLDILESSDQSKHFSLNINFIELHERKIELANVLLREPELNLEEWDKASIEAQMTLLNELKEKFTVKSNVHCRIYYLAHLARSSIFPVNRDAGKFLQISGTVMRITATKLLEYQRNYICVKCKTPIKVKADYDRKYMIKQPTKCENSEGCTSNKFIHFGELDSNNCKDYQEIKIQEHMKKIGVGSMPNTILVTLEDDLVDTCQPGDDVTICGTVHRRTDVLVVGVRPEIELVLKANHVQVNTNCISSILTPESTKMFTSFWEKYSENPLEGRDLILKSFCPQLYGMYPVKLAIAVVLAGGCATQDITLTGVRTRSESHILLVGDPGTGKSQLLKFASKIIPRAVLTNGVGSTSAGLTVTAVMEHGEWQLEAGALVMADGGICCVDEFNSMKEHDRTTLHEAMEQQTISVAKAGIVCKLNTRCSILAACNPKGNVDPTQPLEMNVALPSPLLSRFDLIILLRDTVNQDWDERVIDYILNGGNSFSRLKDFGLWSISNLQTYFKFIKELQPKLSEEAQIILNAYYNIQRRIETRNKARTTVRLLESLIRLSQGHARLMFHKKVLVMDSIYAVFLTDLAFDQETSIFNLSICAKTIFPEKSNLDYKNLLVTILTKLQLLLILEQELASIKVNEGSQVQSRFFEKQKESELDAKTVTDDNNESDVNKNTETNTDLEQNQVNSYDCTELTSSNNCLEELQVSKNAEKTGCDQKNKKICKSKKTTSSNNKKMKDSINERNQISSFTETKCLEKSSEEISQRKQCKNKKNTMFESGFDESVLEFEDTINPLTNSSNQYQDSNISKTAFPNFKCLSRNTSLTENMEMSKLVQSRKNSSCSINLISKKSSVNSVEADLEAIKMIAGANDNLNIDFDMDWDSVGAINDSRSSISINSVLSSGSSIKQNSNLNIFSSSEDVDFDL